MFPIPSSCFLLCIFLTSFHFWWFWSSPVIFFSVGYIHHHVKYKHYYSRTREQSHIIYSPLLLIMEDCSSQRGEPVAKFGQNCGVIHPRRNRVLFMSFCSSHKASQTCTLVIVSFLGSHLKQTICFITGYSSLCAGESASTRVSSYRSASALSHLKLSVEKKMNGCQGKAQNSSSVAELRFIVKHWTVFCLNWFWPSSNLWD